jgi:hypothetical protein
MAIHIYRRTVRDKYELVDKVDYRNTGYDVFNHIERVYLSDSPDGETYFAIDSLTGRIFGVWKVVASKTLVPREE